MNLNDFRNKNGKRNKKLTKFFEVINRAVPEIIIDFKILHP
jgi:hypothetical protein